jgi:hypothetical protein
VVAVLEYVPNRSAVKPLSHEESLTRILTAEFKNELDGDALPRDVSVSSSLGSSTGSSEVEAGGSGEQLGRELSAGTQSTLTAAFELFDLQAEGHIRSALLKHVIQAAHDAMPTDEDVTEAQRLYQVTASRRRHQQQHHSDDHSSRLPTHAMSLVSLL